MSFISLFNPENYTLNVYVILFVISGSAFLFMGLFNFLSNARVTTNFALFTVSLALSGFLFSIAAAYASKDFEQAKFFSQYVNYYSIACISPAILFTTSAYLGILKKYKGTIVLGFIFMIILATGQFIVPELYLISARWHSFGWQIVGDGPLAMVMIAMLFILGSISFTLLTKAIIKERDRTRKRKIIALTTSFFLGYAGGVDFLLDYGIIARPYSYAFELASSLFLFYAILRARILDLNVSAVSENILSATHDAVIFVNNDFEIVFANNFAVEFLAGGDKNRLLGRPAEEFGVPEGMRKALSRGDRIDGEEASFLDFNGKRLFCMVTASEIKDTDGKNIGYFITAKDISGLKDAIQELREKILLFNKTEIELRKKIEQLEQFSQVAANRGVVVAELERKLKEIGG